MTSNDEKPYVFKQAISEAFEPYLSLWVEAQDEQLSTLLPRYKQASLRNLDEDFSPQSVISSSTELFQFYRLTLAQCAKLSTGIRLQELSRVFAKYLDQYSQQVLFFSLGERFGPAGPVLEDIILILNTADYCFTTTAGLEEKIKQRIDPSLASSIDLQSQADAFMGIAGAAVRGLVKKVDAACESAWREMRNTAWARLDAVGDQSGYMGELTRAVRLQVQVTLALLPKHQYARAFCDHVVDALTASLPAAVAAVKPISEAGAEQLLLDTHALKQCLLDLPSLAPGAASAPPTAHVKRVAVATARIDALLKTLQVRAVPPEGLVQAYLIHVADSSEANFRRVLDLKGISRPKDQAPIVEVFQAFRAARGQHEPSLPAASVVLAPLHMPAPGGTAAQAAASFGSSLLSAARDSVDRISSSATPVPSGTVTPTAGTPRTMAGAVASREGSPAPGAGAHGGETLDGTASVRNVSENLRSFGKFFRRDLGGFGRFGTAGGAGSPVP